MRLVALSILMGWTLALAPVVCRAAPRLPEAGLKAEMAHHWEKAITVYRDTLAREPWRTDLWLRLADIQATLGRREEVIASLLHANKTSPKDPYLNAKLSRAYAADNQPHKALAAIGRALRLAPGNVRYIRAQAKLATWAGETKLALRSYEELHRLKPEDPEVALGLARALSWQGELDRSVCLYRRYLKKHPENALAWLEYSRVELWRGNHSAAFAALANYRTRFGDTEEYRAQKARVMARAGWAKRSLTLVSPLLKTNPDDFNLNVTRTLALKAGRRPAEAKASLSILKKLRPKSKDTAGIEKFVLTPLRSHLDLNWNIYSDSDHIRIIRTELQGTWVLQPATRLSVGTGYEDLRVKEGSGLAPIKGGARIGDEDLWAGIRHRFSPAWSADGRAGVGRIEGASQFLLYRAGLDFQPTDLLSFRLENRRELFSASPRSVSLGIKRTATQLQSQWRPNLRYTLVWSADYSTFSDGNRRWEVMVAPRRTVLRTQNFNLDLGLLGWWFGFAKDLNNGYYNPSAYQRYAVTGIGYWKLSENDGISLYTALGVQKDNTMGSFQDGEDVAVQGIFGIFRDWELKARIGYTNRRQVSGAFDAFSGGLTLIRRF